MSTLQSPRTTPKGRMMFVGSGVFTGQFVDPSLNTPILAFGLRYGILDSFDAGLSYFADSAIADVKYGFLPFTANSPLFATRLAGGYGGYSQSYTAFELIAGYNFRNMLIPYGSVRSMNFWQREINMISPAIGVEYLATDTVSFALETRFYTKLPGSNSVKDIVIPNDGLPGEEQFILKHNVFSVHAGVTISFDPSPFD